MRLLFFLSFFIPGAAVHAQLLLSSKATTNSFPIATRSAATTLLIDTADAALVRKSADLFRSDIEQVSGTTPVLTTTLPTNEKNIIIIGSANSRFITQLERSGKLNTKKIRNRWEAFQIQVVQQPFSGIEQALVVCGSDRRGTAYGVFELSRAMGVSPWYWWADVPVKQQEAIYISNRVNYMDAPKVKYRGIFINDEAPALSNWSREKFGGFNHQFYEKVFELMLRLKANYLWPAMWGNAFYDDDPKNIETAETYGIVIGTSHHEPLMRAHDEWRRYGKGKWNYDSNAIALRDFWRSGLQRAGNEKIVTVGMRGDGDEPMSRETATTLLEKIVADQRQLIEDVTGKPAAQTPQLWALYKEVQDYYDKGMRVPDDVTLLLCDDNWGNIRKLPKHGEKKRKGGYGIYYHFDYVGGPRNYKWINTNNLARVWEQMHLAWAYGARQIWIVNVGDIKPMETPTSFFLDYAWNPDRWNEDNIHSYYTTWAAEQFGTAQASAIGGLLQRYAQYSSRRKPELLDANTYSVEHYNEAERVLQQWQKLYDDAIKSGAMLPPSYESAYFQLVLHPILAMHNLHQMYYAVAMNRKLSASKLRAANAFAEKARNHYLQDSLISVKYHSINNGKWNHMMSQTHIGYTYWQQPPYQKMPELHWVPEKELQQLPSADSIHVKRAAIPANLKGKIFYEQDGYVSMEASNWSRAIQSRGLKWKQIPGIGRTGSGVISFPVTTAEKLSATSSRLDYECYNYTTGEVTLHLYFSPTLNFHNNEGLQYAVSIDNEAPQVFSLNRDDNQTKTWESWVAQNCIIKKSTHKITKPGKHLVKYWLISPGVVLQKLVLDLGGLKNTYLGPPETLHQ